MIELTKQASNKPKVVCLCGSTRFYDTWQEANFNETMAGNIVLSVGFYPHFEDKAYAEHYNVTPEQKEALDELHKRKIDLCDEVLVLNVNNYIGASTRSEIDYAIQHNKPVRYLVPELIKEYCPMCGGRGWDCEDDGEGNPIQVNCNQCQGTGYVEVQS